MAKHAKEKTIIHDISEMRAFINASRSSASPSDDALSAISGVGLVPTMGALHEGHTSLINRSTQENKLTIVSIFVNPIQFDDAGDLAAYPKSLKEDADAAFKEGADIIFAPRADEMYPDGFSTFIDMTGPSERLCGASRTSHFRGVLTVVAKLFNICLPDRAYFGEKDAQQLALVRKMAIELCMPTEVIGCPTIREEDGLAMSSRNARLSADERIAAHCLYIALKEAKALFEAGEKNPEALTKSLISIIGKEPLAKLDYAELVDRASFETPSLARPGDLLMLAVYIGGVRLIDNIELRACHTEP